MKKSVFCLSLVALILTSCSNYPSDFVEFKSTVQKRQETATLLRDYQSVSWKFSWKSTDNVHDYTDKSHTIEPLKTEYFNEFDSVDEDKITDFGKYYATDKKALKILNSYGGLYNLWHIYGDKETDRMTFMALLENSYIKESTSKMFCFKGIVDDLRIAIYEISDVYYSTSETDAKIFIKDPKSSPRYTRYKITYNLDNLISLYEADGEIFEFTWHK